jgi:type 1 glutamine amidotransferase
MTSIVFNNRLSILVLAVLSVLLLSSTTTGEAGKPKWKKVKVLVYTKNGTGYVHDNIPNAVKCIQKLGQENGFKVDVSDDPAVFTEANLKQYTMLIFPSTNNDVFATDAQRTVFRRYIQAGGGFVGIHSVTGTERNWKWFKMMLGGTFAWHARNQKFSVKVIEPDHPTVQGLPKVWERSDECYFAKEMYPGINVVMAHDITTLNPNEEEKIKQFSAPFAELYPAVWHQQFDGGNIWITALGHNKEHYEDPVYIKHIFQGIEYIAGQAKKIDFAKAYADSRDTPVRF